MTTIVTRAGKGSPLTHTEVDTNFTNLNTNKFETAAIPLGTLAAPSISFVGDANTGAYSPGADTLAFVTAGSNRVHITSAGLVGIGSSSPAVNLQVNAASDVSIALSNSSSVTSGNRGGISMFNSAISTVGNIRFAAVTDNVGTEIQFYTRPAAGSLTQTMTLDSAGRLGIGTTGPAENLEISSASGGVLALRYTGNSGYARIKTDSSNQFIFENGFPPTPKCTIDSSGRLLVGTSSARSIAGLDPQYQQEAVAQAGATWSLTRNGANNDCSYMCFVKTRSASLSGFGAVINDDNITQIGFFGSSSSSLVEAAKITAAIDTSGTISTSSMPGRLVFATTADGASSPTERMRISANGNVNVVGALSKGSGSFRIDHPLSEKKDTHHLIHSFIEGPQADLIYRGHVNLINGKAIINIDEAARMAEGTFNALCTNVCCFTSNESDWTAVRGSVSDNILTIEAQDLTSTAEVCWMVIGERKDQHMLDTNWTDENGRVITEPLKEVTPSVTP